MPRAEFPFPIEGIRGKFGPQGDVYRKTKHGWFYSRRGNAADPKTPDQVAVRSLLTAASRRWGELTPAQRAAWAAFARDFSPKGKDGAADARDAPFVFNAIAFYSQAAGAGLPSAPPVLPAPASIASAQQEPAASANAFAFRLWHGIADPAGYRVLLKLSPAAAPGRDPMTKKRLWSAGSLQTSGKFYPGSPPQQPERFACFSTLRFAKCNSFQR